MMYKKCSNKYGGVSLGGISREGIHYGGIWQGEIFRRGVLPGGIVREGIFCEGGLLVPFKWNFYLLRFLPYLYTARIWMNYVTSKAFKSSRSQMFYKIGENWKFCNIHRKTTMLESLLNKVAHVLSYDVKFSKAPIF